MSYPDETHQKGVHARDCRDSLSYGKMSSFIVVLSLIDTLFSPEFLFLIFYQFLHDSFIASLLPTASTNQLLHLFPTSPLPHFFTTGASTNLSPRLSPTHLATTNLARQKISYQLLHDERFHRVVFVLVLVVGQLPTQNLLPTSPRRTFSSRRIRSRPRSRSTPHAPLPSTMDSPRCRAPHRARRARRSPRPR